MTNCLVLLMLVFSSTVYSQSEIYFDEGSTLILDSGSEIYSDVVIINGSYTGGGTINGSIAYVLNFSAFLEGFYNSYTGTMVSDTVSVFLRNSDSPYQIADSSEAVLNESGVGTFIFSNVVNGTNYYLVLKHRNSIETWSANPVTISSNSLTYYDFTSSQSKAYGNNMTQTGTVWSVYSGDLNQDGVIDAWDISQVENAAIHGITGYVNSDITGDDFVDSSDLAIVENNSSLYVSVVSP